jgi:hypothetical protein
MRLPNAYHVNCKGCHAVSATKESDRLQVQHSKGTRP